MRYTRCSIVNIGALIPTENVDIHRIVDLEKKILEEERWTTPIAVHRDELFVMDGHHRLAIAKRLCLNALPVVFLCYDDVRVEAWRPGEIITPELILAMARSRKKFPYKTTRHIFESPLPSCNIVLEDLRRYGASSPEIQAGCGARFYSIVSPGIAVATTSDEAAKSKDKSEVVRLSHVESSKGVDMTKSYVCTPAIHILTRSDLSDIELPPADVIRLVEDAYSFYANGESRCPTKLMMPLPDERRDAVSYSMLGYDGALQQLGFKTSYRQGSDNAEKYYTTISLYDDTTGLPFVFMDCHRVGGSRTPATTAIIAKYCAKENARSALMIGTGAQGVNTLPYLLTALPSLENLRLFGTHPGGIAASLSTFSRHFPDREIELVKDVPSAVAESDVVVVASGRAAHPKVQTSWLNPGGLVISVASKGVESGALREADYAIATNEGQLGVTGKRLAGRDGVAKIDAELPEIVAGLKPGRRSQDDRVFAFSSGMVITDIPVAHALAARGIAAGRGKRVELWS